MNTNEVYRLIDVKWADRWQIYSRLISLQIPCQCSIDRPLSVYCDTPQKIIQTWSVVRQFTAPRHRLVNFLNRCWYRAS
jgi:hypothetical protein